MKHLFIVNPVAGKHNNLEEISRNIQAVMESLEFDYEIYVTKKPMDAVHFIKNRAANSEKLRIYACGGDGTLNEVVNGAAGFSNVEITHYPCGTGNDFVKIFGEDMPLFSDLHALAKGESLPIDLIKVGDRYGVNICSVGVDARIGTDVHKYSKLPLIKGLGAYILSLIVNLIKGIGREMSISIDEQNFPTAKYTLLCCCNGSYYGGGFHPVPEARPDDGQLDFLVVKNVSRIGFIRMVGRYAQGRYKELPHMVTHVSGNKLKLSAPKEFVINIDGEAITSNTTEFELVSGALRFVMPLGSTFAREKLKI